jgi:hypothetical protein
VAVALEDESRVSMAQLLGNHHRGNAGSNHQRRIRVTKIVKGQAVELCAAHSRSKNPSHEVVLTPKVAAWRWEHEIHVAFLSALELLSESCNCRRAKRNQSLATRLRSY